MTKLITFSILFFTLISCQQQEVKVNYVNRFSLEIKNQVWKPGFLGGDTCIKTISVRHFGTSLNPNSFTIDVYNDPFGKMDYTADTRFTLQINKVAAPGKYYLYNSWKDAHLSFAFFSQKVNNQQIRYVNKSDSTFEVIVEKIISVENSSSPGIKGSFSGYLYNEVDFTDSIFINKGFFDIPITNRTAPLNDCN